MVMSEKNGGPYTKPEQEKRRAQVFEMHFVKGYFASKIADELGVNKNTITQDIRYWYDTITSELKENARDWALKQYSRMEEQRTRLMELLSKQDNVVLILKIEKMIMELDRTICKFLAPISERLNGVVPDSDAVGMVEHLLINEDVTKATGYSNDQILHDVIKCKKCDVSYAQNILDRIKELGLELFENPTDSLESPSYDMLGFAESRQILSGEQLQNVYLRLEQKQKEQQEHLANLESHDKEVEKKFVEQYGDSKDWTAEVWSKYNHEVGYS